MSESQGAPPEWRVIGETVPGASHLRAGIPNQDALLQVRESGRSLPLVVSVSDGHGSNKCFRSDRGSRFAVRGVAQLVGELLDERRGRFDVEELSRALKETVPREFVRRWREAVERDLKARPFTNEELETLEKKDGPRARKLVEENPLLAYGATSLTVAVEESFILFLQLGDGEILCVSDAGRVSKPLAEDARLFANETTSLCTADAEKNFRSRVQPLSAERPALVLLTTDGYANSFADEAGFLKVGSDLLDMLRADGVEPVNASLKGWLEEATRSGSGDDTTLAILCRMDALKQPQPKPEAPADKQDASVNAATTQDANVNAGAAATASTNTAPAAAPAVAEVATETKAVATETNEAPSLFAATEVVKTDPAATGTKTAETKAAETATPPAPADAPASSDASATGKAVGAALKKALSPPSKPPAARAQGKRKSE